MRNDPAEEKNKTKKKHSAQQLAVDMMRHKVRIHEMHASNAAGLPSGAAGFTSRLSIRIPERVAHLHYGAGRLGKRIRAVQSPTLQMEDAYLFRGAASLLRAFGITWSERCPSAFITPPQAIKSGAVYISMRSARINELGRDN